MQHQEVRKIHNVIMLCHGKFFVLSSQFRPPLPAGCPFSSDKSASVAPGFSQPDQGDQTRVLTCAA